MKPEPTIWGVHNDTLTEEIIAGGFISAGWDKLGDLNNIPDGREGFKTNSQSTTQNVNPSLSQGGRASSPASATPCNQVTSLLPRTNPTAQ